MTNVFTEGGRAGEFVASIGNGHISFDRITFSGGAFVAGEVIAIVGGLAVKLDPTAADGSEIAGGIAFKAVDASEADEAGSIVARHAEVLSSELVWPSDAAETAGLPVLAAKQIIAR